MTTTVLLCWAVGSTCVIAILVKYVRGMHTFGKVSNTRCVNISLQGTNGTNVSRAPVDKWLLMRFMFLFICLWLVTLLLRGRTWHYPGNSQLAE